MIIVEGILLFFDQELREMFDLKLFVDADSDDRLARRVQRDLCERGRSLSQVCSYFFFRSCSWWSRISYCLSCWDRTVCWTKKPCYFHVLLQVLHQYLTLVKPAFEDFCLPTKKYADVVIPRGADNEVAIDLILHHIHQILNSPCSSSHSSIDEGHVSDHPASYARPH